MIERIARNGPPEALICPAFICDACREQVVDHGNIYERYRYVDGRREASPLFVSHKAPCVYAVEDMLDNRFPRGDGWRGGWEEIPDFLRQLANNFRHAFADDHEGEYVPQDITIPLTSEDTT